MNAGDGLRLSAWKYPEKTAAVYFEKRCTYRELDERVNRLANGLLEMGFKKGDKVAYLLYNGIEGLEIIQALLRISELIEIGFIFILPALAQAFDIGAADIQINEWEFFQQNDRP